jgi:diguanylate cyclase (GGDEF)-like protein/PAS domain S-box-containing protein
MLVDKLGFIQACNSVGRSMFQYRNVDIVGFESEKILFKSDRKIFVENLQRSLQIVTTPAKYTSLQLEGLRKDGTTFPVEIHMKASCMAGREFIACTIRDITRRRYNESAIRKKEEKLRLALQGAELWIWEYDCKTQVISYEIQISTSVKHVNNEVKLDFANWSKLIHPDDIGPVLDGWSQLLADETNNFEFEYRVKRANGNWDWIYSCGHIAQRDQDGRPSKVGGTNLNISERKYAQERLLEKNTSLLETERRLCLAQESSGVAFWERDAASNDLTYYSDNLAALYGLDSTEKINTVSSWLTNLHPDDREHIMQEVKLAQQNVLPQFSLEYRVIWPDKSIHWLTSRATVVVDVDNIPTRLTGTTFDTTAQKHAEEKLKESEARFRSAFNQSAIPMLLASSADEGIFRVNAAMCELVGYEEDELLGMELLQLVHPEDQEEVANLRSDLFQGKIDQFSAKSRYLTKSNEIKWLSVTVVGIQDKQGNFRYAVVQLKDITEEHILSTKLTHEATHDSLTGLVNRREFENRLVRVLETIKVDKTENALVYIDLDQFKVINDTCGHAAGDELLLQISTLISRKLRKHDVIARLGGDEFGVFLDSCDLQQAKKVIKKIHDGVSEFRFDWDDKSFNVSMSSGLVALTEESQDIIEVLKQADAACYAAKDAGRNRVHVYHPQDEELSRRSGEMQWVARITRALEEDRFQLYCQPIAPVKTVTPGRFYYEVLLRLQEKNGDLVPPGAFLPAAERYGLSIRLDKWVIKKTLDWLKSHPEHVEKLDLCCINLSGHSLGDQELLAFIEKQFKKNKIPAEKICFEITETAAIGNLRKATEFIKALKQYGCLFALDDFGSGLSSFGYLKSLDVDILKIDGTFVRDIATDPVDLAMVRSINEIGKVLGKRTTAEFVENDEILEILKQIGVDRAQGYGISRPIPIDELCKLTDK